MLTLQPLPTSTAVRLRERLAALSMARAMRQGTASVVVRLSGLCRRRLLRHGRVIVVGTHVLAPVATSYAAFWLRFDGAIPPDALQLWAGTVGWLVVIRSITYVPFRLYEGLWRYTSLWDLRKLAAGITVGSIAFYVLVHWTFGLVRYPRSVFIIDWMLLVFLLGGLRLLPRIYRDLVRHEQGRRILIVGAGDAGEMIARDMLKYADYQPVAFLDDDPGKQGRRIHGVPVVGTREDLPRAIAITRPDEILVAMPRGELAMVRSLVTTLRPFKVPITTLPALRHLIDGKVTVNQIRHLSIEDLLARAPVGLDDRPVRALIEGRSVMVTGAGGSIGSELCRQIAALQPGVLVLYERYENSLYSIVEDLREQAPHIPLQAVIGDVTDEQRLNAVMDVHRPHLVLHAAAHKHVPLMEDNCCEAVKNNVIGTRSVADAARRHGVERFILISSDKAVNPTSVMGATKHVAELVVQAMPGDRTRFVTVRFGNVLGSNGSVVPRFVQQIRAGGPVTVTHPEIRRYFMLIPEAVQLVLHAAALGDGNAVYVLEMGEQIRLVDLARNLIRLSGFVPDREIRIEFTGLRPGEKLAEELTGAGERLTASGVEKILRVSGHRAVEPGRLAGNLARLTRRACRGDSPGVIEQLCHIVPSFRPDRRLVERREPPPRAHREDRRPVPRHVVAAAAAGK